MPFTVLQCVNKDIIILDEKRRKTLIHFKHDNYLNNEV